MNNETFLVIFVGLTGFALLVQAIVMLTALLLVRKTISTVRDDITEFRTTVMPMLVKSKETLEKVAPKIESVAADVAEIAQAAREQTEHIKITTDEILARVHRQTSRVDTMLTNVVDGVEHAGVVVADTVARPVRQINALLASAKAFLTALATGRRPGEQADIVADQDRFV
jgi:hypothetical protein